MLLKLLFPPLNSGVKLNEPKFTRRNHAALCFKKLDPALLGVITVNAFETLFAMLLQNELIGSKSTIHSAVEKMDAKGERRITFASFIEWIELVSEEFYFIFVPFFLTLFSNSYFTSGGHRGLGREE